MSFQVKTEPLEALQITDVGVVFSTFQALHGMGYRGTLSTGTGDTAHIDMSLADAVPVSVGINDVILYRASPLGVVKCVTAEDFANDYVQI